MRRQEVLLIKVASSIALMVLACAIGVGGCRSMIFHPAPNEPALRQRYESHRFEIASHGQRIEGWWIENPGARSDWVVLYFGGNAEDVLYTAGSIGKLNARVVLFSNYRGYGRSTGKAGERALYDDGLALYEYATSRGVHADRVVVMGRSLGSGVAAMIAGSRKVRGAVLISPYDSISSVAKEMYPRFAVSLLIGDSFFPSVDWARKARAPALLLAGELDALIPPLHAQRLSDAWAGKSTLHVLPSVGHNNISQSPDYYPLINRFLDSEMGGS
jgi:pimeloyl-ACP methyl ester carboxylesterase